MTPAWKERLWAMKEVWANSMWFFVGFNIACATAEGAIVMTPNTETIQKHIAFKIVTLVLAGAFILIFGFDIFLEIAISISDSTLLEAIRKRPRKELVYTSISWGTFIFSVVLFGF